jgi:microcystin-dependent protein
MSEPFIAEIRIFAGNFAPRGWALCNGQSLPISQNTALFSIIGTTYGGDGRTTTALPNLQGRFPMHAGNNGPGLTQRRLGTTGGSETVTLSEAQMPQHNHSVVGLNSPFGGVQAPSDQRTLNRANIDSYQTDSSDNLVPMAAQSLPNAGGDQPHNNLSPFLAIHFIIALVGVYPSRD